MTPADCAGCALADHEPAPPANEHPVQQPCVHLWKRARDGEGRPLTRECGPCGGKALDVFVCRAEQRKKDGAFDQVTLNDCRVCPHKQVGEKLPPPGAQAVKARALVLKNHLSPGDVLVMTAAVRSLHLAHPGRFLTGIDSTAPAVWEHNPDVATREQLEAAGGAETVSVHYPLVNQSNQVGAHFMEGYCRFLSHALQVPVPLAVNRPILQLSDEEKGWMNGVEQHAGYKGNFWLLCAGRKNDFTTKFWGSENFQRVVDRLRGKVTFVQVGAAEHHHPPLKGVINFVGKTDQRELIRLCWHAQGVLCGVTFLMHIAAALEKPCVTILGGREPVMWNAYPTQQLLHTVGMLDCCRHGACWRSRTVRLGDGGEQDQSLCEQPLPGDEPVPRCMAMIRPERVAELIADML